MYIHMCCYWRQSTLFQDSFLATLPTLLIVFVFILQGLTLIADITWLSCYGNAALCIPKGTKGDFHLRTSEQTRCPIGKDHGTSILNVISKIPFIFYISFSQ